MQPEEVTHTHTHTHTHTYGASEGCVCGRECCMCVCVCVLLRVRPREVFVHWMCETTILERTHTSPKYEAEHVITMLLPGLRNYSLSHTD